MNKQIVMITVLMGLLALPLMAEVRSSADFEGVLYECEAVPDATVPVWDRAPSAYASSDGSLLTIDVLSAGSAGWHLPGQYGANWAPVDYRNYIQGEPNNPWAPDIINLGYTVEISTEVIDSNPGTWGYSFYCGEANHGGLYDIQIFEDRIKNGAGTVMYSGDLTGRQHRIRWLRYPGAADDPFANPYVEMYVDGELTFTGGRVSEGGIISNAGWDQDWIYMGSLSGSARYHVKTDFIRMDFTGVYEPPAGAVECGDLGFLKGDFDKNCVVDLNDLASMVGGWLLCSDPLDISCLNCNDPANEAFCR